MQVILCSSFPAAGTTGVDTVSTLELSFYKEDSVVSLPNFICLSVPQAGAGLEMWLVVESFLVCISPWVKFLLKIKLKKKSLLSVFDNLEYYKVAPQLVFNAFCTAQQAELGPVIKKHKTRSLVS